MKLLQSLSCLCALALAGGLGASAGWNPTTQPVNPGVGATETASQARCPASTFDVYFGAFDSEVSAEAKALLIGLALAYRSCPVERIEIKGLAVESASPDSTPDIAAKRAENLAGLMRVMFLGRTDVVVRIDVRDDGFGPASRKAQVRLVT